jgi:hypothetical protein
MVGIRALARRAPDRVIHQNSSQDDEFARLTRIAEHQQADGISLAGTLKEEGLPANC